MMCDISDAVLTLYTLTFQRSVVDAVLDATKGRPWLWAVILVVVVLPVVLIIAYCCMSKSEVRHWEILRCLIKVIEPTALAHPTNHPQSKFFSNFCGVFLRLVADLVVCSDAVG